MKKNKVAFQGELGAYSHIAINELFDNPEIKTCATFEETFKVAFDNEDYKIVIPLENSLAGRVADIHYLLPKYKFMRNTFKKLNTIFSLKKILS
jgi:prephenate dehydratase